MDAELIARVNNTSLNAFMDHVNISDDVLLIVIIWEHENIILHSFKMYPRNLYINIDRVKTNAIDIFNVVSVIV